MQSLAEVRMSTSRNAPSLAAAALAAVALLFLSQPPTHAVSHSPLLTSQNPVSPSPQPQLPALLAKAAEYCRKLESSAFDFVCREEIAESIDPSLDVAKGALVPIPGLTSYKGPTFTISTLRKIKHKFVYDYQCVRAGRAIREMRTQLEENGKKKVVPNAELKTSVVVFGKALLGPVGLFGERFQPDYDFAKAGEEKIGKIRVLVVDAKPKPGAPSSRNLYGKAWIDPVTGNILKIEWSESRVGRFDIFEKRGQLYQRKPRLIISSEFSAEKNGIRFPSRLSVEEAYLKESGKAFIRSKTEVVYKDFKFFTVSYDVRD
jgi:hypothetical protein